MSDPTHVATYSLRVRITKLEDEAIEPQLPIIPDDEVGLIDVTFVAPEELTNDRLQSAFCGIGSTLSDVLSSVLLQHVEQKKGEPYVMGPDDFPIS